MDDQTGVGGDAYGFRLVLAGGGNDLHPAADGTATAGQLLDHRCGGTGKELLTQKTFVQAVNHGCRQRRAGHLRSGFPQGNGFIPQLLREILLLLRHIDADADDRAVDGPALGVAGKLGKNPADLTAVDDDIVGPFDAGRKAVLFQYLADRKAGIAGQQTEGGRGALRPEQIGKVHSASAGRGEAASQPSAAAGLAVSHHHGAGSGALQRHLLAADIGGIQLPVAKDSLSPAGGQILRQQLRRQAVRQAGQPVTPACHRINTVTLFPQAAHRLPNSGAGNAKLRTQLLPGVILFPILAQQLQQPRRQLSFRHNRSSPWPPDCKHSVKSTKQALLRPRRRLKNNDKISIIQSIRKGNKHLAARRKRADRWHLWK